MKRRVYFRADGNSQIGLGHIIRSLALAEMLKNDFDCHFIIRTPLQTLKEQILAICTSIIPLPNTSNDNEEAILIAEQYLNGDEIVVLDGYYFKTFYQQQIRDKGCRVVCIDDIHAYHFVADAIINHAGGITKKLYSAEKYTQFYFGLKYALLRKPFREAAKNRTYPARSNSVFICLGGADPNNDTLKILRRCEQVATSHQYYLVIGGAYQHKKELKQYLEKSILQVELLTNLSASQMVSYMKKCGRAITAPSTISFEYLSIGGELYVNLTAANQQNIKDFFIKEKLAFDFTDFPLLNKNLITNSIKKQALFFDGNTDQYFLEHFKALK